MITKKFPWLLILLSAFRSSSAQDGELQYYQNGYYIRQYSEIAGLANNSCKNIFQDSRGFLWITTFKGLSRYDGKEFTNFGTREGLPGSNITQVSEDSLGFIYVATTAGIARYTGYNSRSKNYFHIYPQTMRLGVPIAGMQAVDSNTIIFQQKEGAVFLLKENRLIQLSANAPGSGNVIYRSGFSYYYAFTRDTLRIFDSGIRNIKNIYLPRDVFLAEYVDKTGQLHIYNNGKKTVLRGTEFISKSSVPDSIIWFATNDTSQLIYFRSGELFIHKNGKSSSILNLRNLSLFCNVIEVARDSSIWITSGGGGIFRIKPLHYTTREVPINDFYFSYSGNSKIFITRDTPGNKSDGIKADINLLNITRTVLADKEGNRWYCTTNGVYKQSPGKPTEHYIFPGNKDFWDERANRVWDAVETVNGDIWFYGYFGVVRYGKDGRFKHYSAENGLAQNNRVRKLTADKNGTVILVDYYNSLLQVQGDTLVPIAEKLGMPFLGSDKMNTDNNGCIWVEYDKKIFKIEISQTGNYRITDSIAPSSALARLPEISAFAFDELGNCWIGYTGGKLQVYFINPDGRYTESNSITYTKDDGIGLVAGFAYELWPDKKGNMILIPPAKQGSKTIYIFPIKDAVTRKKMQIPEINLTEILINHQVPDWTYMNYLAGPEGIPSSCRLRHDANNITFNYTGVSLGNPIGIVYQTMLKGYDKEWQTTSKTSVNYTNLPAGRYTFLVRAANANGSWSETCKYYFTILPPWYKTWWASLLWILTGLSIIISICIIRIKSVRIHSLKESNLFKSSLIGLIGHDMMTPLGYIAKVSFQLRVYYEKLTKKTTLDGLGDINTTASQLQYFAESIIHWIKIQNTEFSPVMETFHVNKTIADLVEFHDPLAAEKGNSISHEIRDNLHCCQDPILVRIIIHNLLLNANKFTSRGKIRISALMKNDTLVIKVKDNGRGMDEEKVNLLNSFQPVQSSAGTLKEKGWGMGYKVIIDLLKFSRGTLHIKSHPGEGTEVTIELPVAVLKSPEKDTGEFFRGVKYMNN